MPLRGLEEKAHVPDENRDVPILLQPPGTDVVQPSWFRRDMTVRNELEFDGHVDRKVGPPPRLFRELAVSFAREMVDEPASIQLLFMCHSSIVHACACNVHFIEFEKNVHNFESSSVS